MHQSSGRLLCSITAVFSLVGCCGSYYETDDALIRRFFGVGRADSEISFFSIDEEYAGEYGSVYFVRWSSGGVDTLLSILGIYKNLDNDILVMMNSIPIAITNKATERYLRYLQGDSLYRFVDENRFWEDSTVWIEAIENSEPLSIMHRYSRSP